MEENNSYWVRRTSAKAVNRFCLINRTSPYLLMNATLEKFLKKELANEVKRMQHKHNRRTLKMGYFKQYE